MALRLSSLGAALALCACGATASLAQGVPASITIKQEKPGLLKKATVSAADAQKTAQAAYPTGKIRAAEIEEEGGKLIYSFEIRVPGAKGVEEVNVDAMTGRVVNTEHEDAAAEKKEPAAEKEKAKPKPKAKKPLLG
jgi:hypothetical protein